MVFRIAFSLVALVMSLHASDAAVTMKNDNIDVIMYPGPTKEVTSVPEPCRDKNYCTIKPVNYPEEKFNEMFKDYKAPPESLQPELLPSLDNRQGAPDEIDNCESVVTYEPIYQVRNKKGDWRDVIQAPRSAFVQKVRLETCISVNAKCFTAFGLEDEFQTFCRQKYNTWEVLVSNGENATEKIKTELPVCCSCYYKHLDLRTRLAGSKIVRKSRSLN